MQIDNQEEIYQRILIKRVALFLAGSVFALLITRLSLGSLHNFTTVIGIIAITLYLTVSFFAGSFFSSSVGAWLICITSWLGLVIAGYTSGGFQAPMILAFPLVPLVTALLIEHRAAIIMGILSIISIIIYFILDINNYSLPLPISNYKAGVMRGAWLIFIIFLVTIIGWYYSKKNDSLTRILKAQADTDFLTNLFNRRRLDEALAQEFYRTKRQGGWLSILLFDIDHFKKFNDSEGHLIGDECLKLIAREIRKHSQRATDIAGRYGGEEFMLILPDTEPGNALQLAENLRQAVAKIEIDSAKAGNRNVTITIGCLSVQGAEFDEPNELIKIVDDLLYEGKESGRNIVVSKDYASN